jgi:hypothetical protein
MTIWKCKRATKGRGGKNSGEDAIRRKRRDSG